MTSAGVFLKAILSYSMMRGLIQQLNATFSLVARCSKTNAVGVCAATAIPAVGSVVPYAEAGVGAIATQALTNIIYGTRGLELLRSGLSPREALERMLREDPERESRQVIMIDAHGRTAAFTGKANVDWKGHLIGENYVVAGNMLVSAQVIQAMAEAFETSGGELEERLLNALEAGQKAGGDKRGKRSAALLVMKRPEYTGIRPFIDLRVDYHEDPVKELRRIFEAYKAWSIQP
jgi:uncharacterized Ntn-hydrolase superfamily protein